MYELFLDGNQVVVPSRFIKGGTMKKCPIVKAILVRAASFFLYFTKSVPVRDSTNGFRLFSKKILDAFTIESTQGFAYSIELLVKASKKNIKISELPAKWEERDDGSRSRFKIINWFPDYWRWFLYGLLK
jgi:dolichol-phosphate mannosyltransferase